MIQDQIIITIEKKYQESRMAYGTADQAFLIRYFAFV